MSDKRPRHQLTQPEYVKVVDQVRKDWQTYRLMENPEIAADVHKKIGIFVTRSNIEGVIKENGFYADWQRKRVAKPVEQVKDDLASEIRAIKKTVDAIAKHLLNGNVFE